MSVGIDTNSVLLILQPITRAPAITGAFYFFSHTRKTANQPSIPGTIASKEAFSFWLSRGSLEELLAEAPRMKETEVIEIIDSADFEELPAELRQALTDRMLDLALKPDTEKSGQKSGR